MVSLPFCRDRLIYAKSDPININKILSASDSFLTYLLRDAELESPLIIKNSRYLF